MSFKFTSGQGTAANAQSVIDRMQLQQSLNVEYDLNVIQPLGLVQIVAGPVQELINQALGITQQVVTQHGVPYSVIDTLGLSDSAVHAGSFGGGVVLVWLLLGGLWNDLGRWDDAAVWED